MSALVHALVIPYPLESHSSAMVNLCLKLASRGITITYVYTEGLNSCQANTADIAQKAGLDIRLAKISDGLPIDFDRSLHNQSFLQIVLNCMAEPVEDLIQSLNTYNHPISCIIADAFLPWAVVLAKKLSLPLVALWTQSALVYSIYYHSDKLISHGHFPCNGRETQDSINYIPGVPSLRPNDLPSYFQATEMTDIMLHVIFLSFESVREADWVLMNSVHELETQAIQYCMNSNTALCSIGPLLPSEYFDNHPALEYDFTVWLNSKPPNSVIYVSFDAAARVSKDQIEEIAKGLLDCRVTFLWVLPSQIVCENSTLSEVLPHGFLEEIEDKGLGLVVPEWSERIHYAVLSHHCVGGFFTHCNWDSILQSVCMGVPMLGFPLYADQYTNCRLISEEIGIALKVKNGESDRKLIVRKEISRNVKELINGKEGGRARKKIRRLSQVTRKATIQGGSSDKTIDKFVKELVIKVLHG